MSKESIDIQGFKIVRDNVVEQIGQRRVVKSNKIVESRQRFSLIQQRAIILGISQIKRNDEKLMPYKINISDVLALPKDKKISGAQYKQVREELMKLTKTSIDVIKSDKSWKSYGFISSVEKKEWNNFVVVRFNEEVKPFLLNLKDQYTSYFVKSVEQFKKAHSIRIYELCKQYLSIGSRKVDYNFLLDMLYLKNSKSYQQYYIFNSSVLKPCVKEINETSDIFVEYEPIRTGRKVTAILFKMRAENTTPTPLIAQNTVGISTVGAQEIKSERKTTNKKKEIAQTLVSQPTYDRLIAQYPKEKVDYAIECIAKKKDVSNPRGYLIKALKEGYFEDMFHHQQIQEDQKQQKVAKQQEKQQKEHLKAEIAKAFDVFRKELIKKYLDQSTDEDLEEFLFEHEISDNSIERKYVNEFKEGSPSVFAQNFFAEWRIKTYGEENDKALLSVKEFARQKYSFNWE